MTITSSGTIAFTGTNTSAGGTRSIQQEINGNTYLSPFASTISLNDAVSRSVAGVPSGAIAFSNFYGKSWKKGMYWGGSVFVGKAPTYLNACTRIDYLGALIGGVDTSAGTGRGSGAGAECGENGLFYGGTPSISGSGAPIDVTRINSNGALVGSETTVGTAGKSIHGGAPSGGIALFYAGQNFSGVRTNTVQRITSSGATGGSETTAGTARWYGPAGTPVGGNGLFYGGETSAGKTNLTTRIDSNGAIVGSETNVGTARMAMGGATPSSGNGMFFGGQNGAGAYVNTVTRISSVGAIVGSETTAGTARGFSCGATVGQFGCYVGGYDASGTESGLSTRIDSNGAIVGSEFTPSGGYIQRQSSSY